MRIISQRVAPSASAASLCADRHGRDDLAARSRETIGRIMIARISPAMK